MALGAAIGVGLFLVRPKPSRWPGLPSWFSHALGGFAILIMRALGEMAIHDPVAGSFSRYALKTIWGPLARLSDRLELLVLWIVTCMAEITAVACIWAWVSGVSSWVWALSALVIMASVNFIAVKTTGNLNLVCPDQDRHHCADDYFSLA